MALTTGRDVWGRPRTRSGSWCPPKLSKRRPSALSVILFTFITIMFTLPACLLFWTQDSLLVSEQGNFDNKQLTRKNYGFVTRDGTSGGKLWEVSADMPAWMTEYFDWHITERQRLENNPNDWKSFRFIMLQCLPGSRKCGGTADRLKPLPLFLLLAHRTKRLLFIKWGRPADLEEFLLPPQGGIDWRVPDWLYAIKEFREGPRATNTEELIEFMENPEFPMVKARVQAHDHGAPYYDGQRKDPSLEPTFAEVYHACWRILFTPAPPIARLIEEQMQQAGLKPGNYVGIHIRALYAVEERDPALVQHWARNAVNCASQLQKGDPFYVSSDSEFATKVAAEYGQEKQVHVASRIVHEGISHSQPYHLDKAPRTAKAVDFYDTFVDLYLLALSRCVTYNMGGFGTWALYISPFANDKRQNPNGSCSMQHHEAAGIHKCEWAGEADAERRDEYELSSTPLFIPPMTE